MIKRNILGGIILILFGIAIFLNNYIMTKGFVTILIGLFLLYLYYIKRFTFFLLIGLVSMASGLLTVIYNRGVFNFEVKGEAIFVLAGLIFVALYYNKKNIGFIFPGAILISFGLYKFAMNFFHDSNLWPSFFILLGMAFYFIYFAAFYNRERWTLIIGTIFCLFGIVLLGCSYGILNYKILRYQKYIWPLALISMGIFLLFKLVFRSKQEP